MQDVKQMPGSAIEVLDRMQQVVDNEMLRRGTYITDYITDHDLELDGAVCGGRQACAIGALGLGAGVEYTDAEADEEGHYVGSLGLPGVAQNARDHFMSDKPHLRAAFDALEKAAHWYVLDVPESKEYADASETCEFQHSYLEALFESSWWSDGDEARLGISEVIGKARELLLVAS